MSRPVGEPAIPGRRILLTGAAGLLGGEMAGGLTDRGYRITALIHDNPEVRRNDGSAVDVDVIEGNVSRPGLGLGAQSLERVSNGHDLLIHCAALTGFGLADEAYRAVNIEGTRHVVDLARRGGMPVLHVSTAYVCGLLDGPIAELPVAAGQSFANGYEASKAEAERLVRKSGVPAAIARPSIVVGEWQSGRIRAFETIYAAFRLIAEGHIRTMPAATHATLDFVPIDHVAAGIADLAERIEQAIGGIFHLTSNAPITIAELQQALCERPDFVGPDFVAPELYDTTELSARERRLHDRVVALYASYLSRDPRFDDSAFRALTGRVCPPTGIDYLRRLIDYTLEAGFIRPAPQSRPGRAALQGSSARA